MNSICISLKLIVISLIVVKVNCQQKVFRVVEGDNVYLWCDEAARNRSTSVTWTFRGLQSKSGSSEIIFDNNLVTSNRRVSIGKHRRLVIKDIQFNERGIYECTFKTSTSSKTTSTTVHVDPIADNPEHTERGAWPKGIVPYRFENVTNKEREVFESAFRELQNGGSCVQFVPLSSKLLQFGDTTPLVISKVYDSTICENSTPCYGQLANSMRLGANCIEKKHIFREMLKVLCLDFELQRTDRDKYVAIDEERPYSCSIPAERTTDAIKNDILYDYLSVTHPICSQSCLAPKLQSVTRCGLKTFSSLDIEKINFVYGCKGCNAVYFKPISSISFGRDQLILTSEKARLGICRKYRSTGEITPGRFNVDKKSCDVWDFAEGEGSATVSKLTNSVGSMDRDAIFDKQFEVLSNPGKQRYEWQWGGIDAKLPERPIPGGRTADGTYLYFCRCVIRGGNQDIKVAGKLINSKCFVPEMEEECEEHEFLNCVEQPGSSIGSQSSQNSQTWVIITVVILIVVGLIAIGGVVYWFKSRGNLEGLSANYSSGRNSSKMAGNVRTSRTSDHDYEAVYVRRA